jgi:hypothetical protein
MDTVRKDDGQYERCGSSYLKQLGELMSQASASGKQTVGSTSKPDEPKLNAIAVDFPVTSATMGRKLFFTQSNYMGVGPPGIKPGDLVYVLKGGLVSLFFVVRQGIAASSNS